MKTYSVINAQYLGNFKIEIQFSDHTQKVVDFNEFLKTHKHPQFELYSNENNFTQFKIEGGNLVWGDNWDLIFPLSQLHNGLID
jgi:hypothetical protein